MTDSDFEVHVTEPTKCGDSLNSYISYKLVTKTKRQGFEQGEVSVIRRYSDFLWLSEDLTRLHPGIIIPCLPEKQSVGRFIPEFVEARRRSLEKFLQRISEHHTLGFSTSFIKFLQAGDAQFLEAKEITKASKAKVTDKAKSWFQGATNSLMASAGGASKKPEPEKTPAELKIDEIAVYMTTVQKRLDTLHKNASNLVKKSGESANSMFELSQGLSALGQTEGEAIGNGLNQVGTIIEKFSYEAVQNSEMKLRELEEPVEEYVRYVIAVKATLARNAEKKAALRSAQLDLELKEQAHSKVANVAGKEKDAATKQDAFEKAQQLHQTLKADYDALNEQVLSEFASFKKQKSDDYRNIVLRFAMVEADFNQKAEKFWRQIIPIMEALDGGAKGKNITIEQAPVRTQPLVTDDSDNVGANGNVDKSAASDFEEV